MRFVSYKMSLWLHRAIDESQMDLWLWLHCKPTFAITCWTSATRHLKLKTAINKLIIFLSKMCSSVSHPPWGVTVFSSHYSSQLCCCQYSSFPFFSTIGFQKSLLCSNRFPRFFTPTSAPSYSVKSSGVQSLKYNRASIHPYHCPFAKSPNGPIWVFVSVFCLFVLSCLVLGFVFLISYTVLGRPKVVCLPGCK